MTPNGIHPPPPTSLNTTPTSNPTPSPGLHRKRSLAASDLNENPRKATKVTRACDRCKRRKAKCSGTNPCESCELRRETCSWDAKYSRGVPKTPLPAYLQAAGDGSNDDAYRPPTHSALEPQTHENELSEDQVPPCRGSPDIESARIRGQYYDSTSGLTFVHRAYRRLSMRQNQNITQMSNRGEKQQLLISAGDWPPVEVPSSSPWRNIPGREQAKELVRFYFEYCVVTYRLLHQPSVELWLEALHTNMESGSPLHNLIGYAKASIVITIFAIASFRREQVNSMNSIDGTRNFADSDKLFLAAKSLTDAETGLPRLESAQARLMQVLYLLQTARMNQAWYVFGHALQIISALALHRKPHSIWDDTPRTPGRDYINLQCRKRTFWMAYTLDKYLCIVLGRPTHYHDNDIDQEFPDRVNDDEMEAHGPSNTAGLEDCLIDGLIAHAKLARIIGGISSDVYNIRRPPKHEITSSTQRYAQKLDEWRDELPPHLGAIKPSSLVPEFRRQSIALKLAFVHAKMHLNRPWLLGDLSAYSNRSKLEQNIVDCLAAAQEALQIVNSMALDGTLMYSLWWMYYVAFCALSVVYIWEIHHRAQTVLGSSGIEAKKLLLLAERCHAHLAEKAPINSPSRAYSIVLEELRDEARQHESHRTDMAFQGAAAQRAATEDAGNLNLANLSALALTGLNDIPMGNGGDGTGMLGPNIWDGWETADWLDFDSSAYLPLSDVEANHFM